MKLCFPIETDLGMKSPVNVHFGSTKSFLIYDADSKTHEIVQNADSGHAHGMCHPLKALQGKSVEVVIVGGIGMGALSKLLAMGVKVYQAVSGAVEKNLELYEKNELKETSVNSACAGHGDACGH